LKYLSAGFLGGLIGLLASLAFGVVLALLTSGCVLPGYVEVPPMEGQHMERRQCDAKQNAEDRRRCHSLLDRKWARYNGEGGYPVEQGSCGGSADCRGVR
jgi:hypothetical protein